MSSLLVFNRVYRLEIQPVMLVFLTGFVKHYRTPLTFSLVSSPPLPCVYNYGVYTYTIVRGGEYGVIGREGGPQTDKTPAEKPLYWSIF
jgi:hypothetical protein